MARPKRNYDVKRVGIKLTLVIGEDDDLIGLLERVPRKLRAITVKSALRGHAMQWSDPNQSKREESAQLLSELDGFVW